MVLYLGLKLQHLCALFVWEKKVILEYIGHHKFIKYRAYKEKLKELLRAYFYGLCLSTATKNKKQKKQRKKTRHTRDLSWEQLCGDNCSFQGSCSFMLYGKDRWHVARQKIQISPVKII